MTRDVKTSQSSTPLFEICKIMKNNNIGSIIVVNESKSPLGIITERDIVNNLSSSDANLQIQVNKIMSTPLITIKETNSLIDALQVMNTNHFRRLPITNNEQKLVGILTDKDIFKAILRNKELLSDYYNNKEFEPSYSVLEEFRDRIFETIFKP